MAASHGSILTPTPITSKGDGIVLKSVVRLTILAALAVGFALPLTSASAATRCPATFQVLHNDRIGAMTLPAGPYRVTVDGVSCPGASQLFANFLQDYDGVLPGAWTANAARRSFTDGRRGFSVRPVKANPNPPTPPAPPGPPTPTVCPGTFSVLHNDRVGGIPLPKGRYTITVLTGTAGLPCTTAARLYAQFLYYPAGDLPGAWTALPTESPNPGAFFNNVPGDMSFRVDRTPGGIGGGGQSHGTLCGTFRVLHNDNIGSLYVPRGTYNIVLPRGSVMDCDAATRQFTAFLDAARLSGAWRLNPTTATFTKGTTSATSFRIEPRSGSVR